ncbi:dihydroorotate dehydrogenase-like protein [Nodosilinea sp. P-1105]|uniref:dihydroorotate dehydrogenase-like protein n=1 Tax=Nodosilinea sp. P-1105 TaxID=2546229 RepID=UPI00146BBFD5|nr:dihydroorotate dehydrogenase-like protein [Nodosilinea sp. P-1105]NMF86095.1 dihydroorotate dehydrogenase-like protein [Nodosilinea sp. P-1105]
MDLTTQYLGLTLKSPLVVGAAAPLTEDLDNLRWIEDSGAAAIVLHSLFEEQIRRERLEIHHHTEYGTESFAEALTYFPEPETFHVGTDAYLNHIRQAKAMVDIPIIASLNGTTLGGWIDYAQQMQQAGADAIELNIYWIPTDLDLPGADVEQTYVDIVNAVTDSVQIPVAVKVGPYFSNMANMAKRLHQAGVEGLVLFNRFYQPDIDIDNLEIEPNLILSAPQDQRLPLTWIALLYGKLPVSLAATSGISRAEDVVKLLMAGADVTMLVATLLRHGIGHLKTIEENLHQWLDEHEYESLDQLRGSMSQLKCPNPSEFERVQYMRAIQSYHPIWAPDYQVTH